MKTTAPKHAEFIASSNDSVEKLSKIYESLKTKVYIMSARGKSKRITKAEYNKLISEGMSNFVKIVEV